MPRSTKATKKSTAKAAKKSPAKTATKAAKAAKATKATKSTKSTKAKAPTKKATKATKSTKAKAPTKKAKATKATKAPAKATKAPAKATKAPAKATKAPAKRAKAAPLDKFVEGQRKALLEERDVYTRQATTLQAEADQLAQDREPGDVQFDEESGEGDTMNVERERDLALSAQALAAVEDIDRALARIENGSYGICEKCGDSIPKERLRALPYASLCVRCKSGGLGRR